MYEKQKIPESRRNRLYLYFKRRLQQIGCCNTVLLSTADSMVRDTLRILKLEVERECEMMSGQAREIRALTKPEYDRDFLNWFAGFWEGEGYLGVYKTNRRSERCYGKMGIYQNNIEPLLLIQKIFGGGIIKHSSGKKHFSKKPVYCWYLSKTIKLIEILEVILPFLRFKQDHVKQTLEKLKEIDSKAKFPKWSEREIAYLKENYGKIPSRVMAKNELHRHSSTGIHQKARK